MRKRLRSHEGANAVEFALVLPILLLLLFGAITFGLAFNAKQQLEHANREGVRYAATLPGAEADLEPWFKEVFERTVATAAGQAPVSDPTLTICAAVELGGNPMSYTATGGSSYTSVDDMFDSYAASNTLCRSDGLNGDRVQVTLQRDARLDAVFFGRIVTLDTFGVARYEGGN